MPEGLAPEEESPPAPKRRGLSPVAIIAIVVLGLSLAIIVALWMLPDAWLARARDVSIAFLSIGIFFSLVLSIMILAVMVWGFQRLSRRLDDLLTRGGAVVDQVKGTATTIKGTAEFVGERIASPFIRLSALGAGIGKSVATLFRRKQP